MAHRTTKYRVSTTEPVAKADVHASFSEALVQPHVTEADVWHCKDGSTLAFSPSGNAEMFYVEFQCQFNVEPNAVTTYGLLPEVIGFCKRHGGNVKVIRNGAVLPASGGMYSDVFASRAHRVVSHLASHPRDLKAKERHTKQNDA